MYSNEFIIYELSSARRYSSTTFETGLNYFEASHVYAVTRLLILTFNSS